VEEIPFIDLQAQRTRLGDRIDKAIAGVVAHGRFIMGPEVEQLESRLCERTGAAHCVTCSSGTDALVLMLMAYGIGPGDGVLIPSMTFAATAEAVALLGASPIFVDVGADTFTMDPASLKVALPLARDAGVKPRAVIPVDLFGQPANYSAIDEIASEDGLAVMADGAQSFGAEWNERPVGTLAPVTATSFFPAKPLGCYGDGGAVFAQDDETAKVLRSLRVHGMGSNKYENVRIGLNARMDTIQAAVLLEKLEIFNEEIRARDGIARRYSELLAGVDGIDVPRVDERATSAWAQYTIKVEQRDAVIASLARKRIPTQIYYPTPLHRQPAYKRYLAAPMDVTDQLADVVVSIPMHPYLSTETQDSITSALQQTMLGS